MSCVICLPRWERESVFGKACETFLLVVVLVLVLGSSVLLDYDYEDHDEDDRRPTFFNHALRSSPVTFWRRFGNDR